MWRRTWNASQHGPAVSPQAEPLPRIELMADELNARGRYIVLAAAFLGWMFSGFQMAVMTLAARSATTEFLHRGMVTSLRQAAAPQIVFSQSQHACSQPPPAFNPASEGFKRLRCRPQNSRHPLPHRTAPSLGRFPHRPNSMQLVTPPSSFRRLSMSLNIQATKPRWPANF